MADSRLLLGASPAAVIIAAWTGSSCQLLSEERSAPLASCSSRVGSASALGTPKAVRLGPIPRTMTLSAPLPLPRMKPAITTSVPVLTKARVLILASLEAAARSRSYTSTKATPVVLLLPRTIAVYAPGARLATIADSRLLVGGSPVAWISCSWVSLQLSLMIVAKPAGPCSSSTGSASGSGTPKADKEGPMARTITRLGALPVTMKPPMPTLAPVWTSMRVDRFTVCAAGIGVGVGLVDGVGVGVAVGVTVGEAVGVAEGVAVGET